MTILTYDDLKKAVEGSAAAFRLTMKLEAVSPKVFPPTYEGGKYATEMRRIDAKEVPCVLLDSVQSQANRMELALQGAWETIIKADEKESRLIDLPVVSVDFSVLNNPGVSKITSLQAPHRIADAILRDSLLEDDGKPPVKFRASKIGQELDQLSLSNATPLLKFAPHCLVFGMWDSTGPRGGLGVKFARALVSEIVGVNAVAGVKTSSRIDPLNIRVGSGPIYRAKDGGWTVDEGKAQKEGDKYVLFKNKAERDSKKEGKPASIIHGNIKPVVSSGGFTIDYAEQTTVLSLPALRRLHFPVNSGQRDARNPNVAARTYLATLGLLGATLAIESGYDLRSRCVLHAKNPVQWYLLGRPGDEEKSYELSRVQAIDIYKQALTAVGEAGLPIHTKEIVLVPTDDLTTLVKRSMELAAENAGETD
jgi:CRISPR-associated protein Csb1